VVYQGSPFLEVVGQLALAVGFFLSGHANFDRTLRQ